MLKHVVWHEIFACTYQHCKTKKYTLMKKLLIVFALILMSVWAFGQKKYITRTGHVSFFSDAPLEDITADNHQVTAIQKTTGEVAYKVPIKSFEFTKALMQEHFNENYMESDKFPEATFSGAIEDLTKVDFTKSGTYKITVKGKLTIHGVTKEVSVPGEVIVDIAGGKVTNKTTFNVVLKDYGIKNDKANQIADTIAITVNAEMVEQK
jgi:polyisoprenoid-binding protein YceI